MKLETIIFDQVKAVISTENSKTIFFISIRKNSYEGVFYTWIEDKPVQCYQLAERGLLDESVIDSVLEKVVEEIRKSAIYKEDKNNIITIFAEPSSFRMENEYYKREEHIYKIKKEWEKLYLN